LFVKRVLLDIRENINGPIRSERSRHILTKAVAILGIWHELADGKHRVHVVEVVHCQPNLFEIVLALRAERSLTHFLYGGQ